MNKDSTSVAHVQYNVHVHVRVRKYESTTTFVRKYGSTKVRKYESTEVRKYESKTTYTYFRTFESTTLYESTFEGTRVPKI